MAEESKAGDVAIDEDFYSRQLLVLGRAAMERMAKYSVLIVGLTGLGCEVGCLLAAASCALGRAPTHALVRRSPRTSFSLACSP